MYHGGFSPDGKLIVTSSYEGTSRVWDARTGEPVAMRHLWAPVTESWFSPDGEQVLSVERPPGQDLERRSAAVEGLPLAHGGDVLHAEFSRDGGRVVTCGTDGMARVWDSGSGRPHPPIAHNSDVTWASLSPDGRYLLTASIDRSARIWDLSAGTWPTQVLRHGSWVSHGELSPDGRRAVAISRDGICRIWNLASGKPELVLDHGHRGDYATFSPDGLLIATVGYDGAARVWRRGDRQLLARPMVHTRRQGGRFLYPDQKIHVVRFDRQAESPALYSPREAIVWDWRAARAARTIHPEGGPCLHPCHVQPRRQPRSGVGERRNGADLAVVRRSPCRSCAQACGIGLHAVFSATAAGCSRPAAIGRRGSGMRPGGRCRRASLTATR